MLNVLFIKKKAKIKYIIEFIAKLGKKSLN